MNTGYHLGFDINWAPDWSTKETLEVVAGFLEHLPRARATSTRRLIRVLLDPPDGQCYEGAKKKLHRRRPTNPEHAEVGVLGGSRPLPDDSLRPARSSSRSVLSFEERRCVGPFGLPRVSGELEPLRAKCGHERASHANVRACAETNTERETPSCPSDGPR